MDGTEAWKIFAATVPEHQRSNLDAVEAVNRLGSMLDEGRQAWPSLGMDEAAFVRHAASHATTSPDVATWLQRVRGGDLWLAFACSGGARTAIAEFERTFARDLRKIVDRFARSPTQRDDLMQILRTKLFVGDTTRPPKLAGYAGVGFLQNWLRITATRTFVDLTRAKKTPKADTPLDLALASGGDVEVHFLKEKYRHAFKAAFAAATAELEPSERNMLRYRLEGLSVDQLGALEGIHRSTAARRLARARHSLLDRTRAKLGEQLGAGHSELDSVMDLFRSRLDVSLERLLEPEPDSDD